MQTQGVITNNTIEYSIVRLSKSNLEDLARLHSVVYAPVAADHYVKKYDTAYTGVEYVGFIAYNDGIPIAFYGVVPCFVQSATEIILAAQSADTMTHPGYRMKGIFMELSNKTFELCRQLGIRIVFGFPNQNSYHGALKLGWKQTEIMECFTIPVQTLPLKSFAGRNFFFKKIYSGYCDLVLRGKRTDLDGVLNSVQKDGFAGVFRTKEYLHYKKYTDTIIIVIENTKLWLSFKNGLVIGDIDGINKKSFAAVMKRLKNLSRRLGIRQIQFHTSTGTRLHKLFSTRYKATPSFPVLFQDFGSLGDLETIKFTFADIDIF
jgi:GNAT superfamily N-acetyltransferase